MVKMINPEGKTVDVPESKVERNLSRGFKHKTATPKTTQPLEVAIEESHDEADHNEEEV